VLTKPKLNYLGQRAKKMVASGDLLGAVRLTLHEVAIQLVGHRCASFITGNLSLQSQIVRRWGNHGINLQFPRSVCLS